MDKKKFKKIFLIPSVCIAILLAVGFGTYKYITIKDYNKLITDANKCMDSGEYGKAIPLYEQSLKYKKDIKIQSKIKVAKSLKECKIFYEEGKKLISDRRYLQAIELLKKITKEDDKLYSEAKKSIEECKKKYITEIMNLSNFAAQRDKYDEANNYLNDVFKLDSDNLEAKKLKDKISSIQKQENEIQ